ncbi:MAG TPA: hypothetical protein VFQ21_11940, partial [Gemmatimonadota bacterium]|nr:hypothetical protein [Gemmatimonadota bacterium]
MRSLLFLIGLLAAVVFLEACDRGAPLEPERGDPATARTHQDRSRIVWPSREFRTLQDAIDAAPAGATLEIQAGDHFVATPLEIRKDLTLAGAGAGRDGTGP